MLNQTDVIREAYEENLMEFVLFCDKEDYGLLLSYYGKHVIEPLTDEDHEVKDSGDISALLEYTLELQDQYRAL